MPTLETNQSQTQLSPSSNNGKLYIVAVPIGNYADMSPRAIEVLKMVDFVIVEDTRHSGKLLKHFVIKKKMQALHDRSKIVLPFFYAWKNCGKERAPCQE